MDLQLTDKVCLITGADEGVGKGLVEGFLHRGASVAAGTLRQKPEPCSLEFSIKMDVTDGAEVKNAIEETISKFGRIDILINNAGIYPRVQAQDMSAEDWSSVIDVNLNGTWRCISAALPYLKETKGKIINVGSITLRTGTPGLSHYIASKGGIVGLTRGLAREFGPAGIRVNCVNLGAVHTEGEARLFPDQAAVDQLVEASQCLGGRMTPASVEPVFAFLASDLSNDITGQCLTVDRGWVHE